MNNLILQVEAESTRIGMPDFWAMRSLTSAYQWLRRRRFNRFCVILQPDGCSIIPFQADSVMDELGFTIQDCLETAVYSDTAHFYVGMFGRLYGPIGQADAYTVGKRVGSLSPESLESFIKAAKQEFTTRKEGVG